jgi:pilin isopeptide linkage protein
MSRKHKGITMKKILIFYFLLVINLVAYAFPVAAYEPVNVDIWVDIVGGGTVEITPEVNSPLPEKSNITLEDGNSGAFHIAFDEIGDYTYTIKTIPDKRNIIYDSTVYSVKCYVRDDNGKLFVTTIIYRTDSDKKYESNDAKHKVSVSFKNILAPPNDDVETTVSKKDNETDDPGEERTYSNEESGSKPKTGDNSQLEIYLIVCMLSSACLFALSVAYYRNTNKTNE